MINFNYVFQLPSMANEHSLGGKFVNGWSLVGVTAIQSGQPYSIIDFSGAIGSIYYSTYDGITNPIVPLASGCTAKTAHDRRFRRMDHGRWQACTEAPLLHAAPAAGRRPEWRHSRHRSL